ncbi:MAG: FAD:protein transferase, partial [Gaiellales bacterium]|nr:FAD:protein transferase [Gaiellales bacterium]
ETNGFFDVRAASPWMLEPSGLVKGWSVDRVSALLEAAGLCDFAVSAGGDVVTRGRALPDDYWRVGIQHPGIADRVAKVVVANDLAIATSGAYARGDHVLDPHTGRSPTGVLSVTITGPELATADAYATAAFAMGTAGPAWTARLDGYEAMTILSDGRVLSTPGFPGE